MKGGFASLGLASLSLPTWELPALAQGETEVPFVDFPATFNPNPGPGRRFFDTRKIDNFITPADQYYTFQHFSQPMLEAATFKLKVAGMFSKPRDFSLAELQALKPALEQVVAYECGGNSPARNAQGMVSNGRWKGVGLATLLKACGMSSEAKEVAFYGADFTAEDVTHGGGGPTHIDKAYFARSLSVEHAMKPEPMLAWELNGAPLTVNQGSPLRLIVPGWYAVTSIKWLTEIALIEEPFRGFFQADRYWYEWNRDGRVVSEPVRLQRVRALVTEPSFDQPVPRGDLTIRGVAWSGAAGITLVEVRVGEGDWQAARIVSELSRGAWCRWELITHLDQPGLITIRARATDLAGDTQPNRAEWNRLGYGNNSIQTVPIQVV